MKKSCLIIVLCVGLFTFFLGVKFTRHQEHKVRQLLRVNLPYYPTTFDPRVTTDPTSATLHLMLYEGLTRLKSNGSVELCLAKNYTLSDDKLTYTFHLKKSQFSDGSSLTAFDFERSWHELLNPDFISRASQLLFCIKNAQAIKLGAQDLELGIKALDAYTLQVVLEQPTPYFLSLLAYPTFFPVHTELVNAIHHGAIPITNGAFKLMGPLHHDKLCLTKNKAFHHSSKVALSQIILDVVPDEMTSFYLFEQGQNHWFGGLLMPIPPDSLSRIARQHTLYQKPTTGFTFCCLNNDHPLLRNLNIRKALYAAIEPKTLIDIFPILVHATSMGPTPDDFWTEHDLDPMYIHMEDSPRTLFKRGLEELGMSEDDLEPLSLIYFNSDLYKRMAQIFQEKIQKQLGLKVKLTVTPITEHFHKLKTKSYDMAITAWVSQFHDPINYLERFDASTSTKNYSGWEDRQFMALIRESSSKEESERASLLRRAEQLIIDDLPILPLYHFNLTYLQNDALEDVEISPLGLMDFRYAFFKIM